MARYNSGVRYGQASYDSPEINPTPTRSTMINLSRYFDILFLDPAISLDELVAFATDHLQRMIANNPGAALNTYINATTVALTTLGQCTSSDIVKLGIRKAAKQAKNTFREALPANIRRIAQRVAGEYGDPSLQITACFPNGRDIYGDCPDDHVDDLLQGLITALTPLAPVMGNTALNDASGLYSTWIALYAASEAATGTKTTTEAEKRAAREALARQLTLNLLALAALFLGDRDKANLYFQQYLLGTTSTPPEDEPEPTPVPPPPGP